MEEPSFNDCLKRWRLADNPFDESYPIRHRLYARPPEELKELKYLISSTAERSSVLNLVVLGDIGSGKTYLMKSILEWLNETNKGIGLYVVIPKRGSSKGFRDLYEDIIRRIGIKRLSSIGRSLAAEYGASSLEEMLLKIDDFLRNQDFARALANITFENEMMLSWTWLTGNATIHQDRALGMTSTPKNETNALDILLSAFRLIATENHMVVLLLDELENLVGRGQAVESIRDGIRNLHDRLIYEERDFGVAVVSSVTAGFLEEVRMSLGGAVFDRARRLQLDFLNPNQGKEFVECLLNSARISQAKSDRLPLFSSEQALARFIESSFKMTRLLDYEKVGEARTPRGVCKAGQSLLDYCCQRDIVQVTDSVIDTWAKEAK